MDSPGPIRHLRNFLIINLLALGFTVLPGAGNVANAIGVSLTLMFGAAILMFAVQGWRQTWMTRDVMTEQQRRVFYVSLGLLALMVAGLDELAGTGPGMLVLLAGLGAAIFGIVSTWIAANSD